MRNFLHTLTNNHLDLTNRTAGVTPAFKDHRPQLFQRYIVEPHIKENTGSNSLTLLPAIRPELSRIASLPKEQSKSEDGSSQGRISDRGNSNIMQDIRHDFRLEPMSLEHQSYSCLPKVVKILGGDSKIRNGI